MDTIQSNYTFTETVLKMMDGTQSQLEVNLSLRNSTGGVISCCHGMQQPWQLLKAHLEMLQWSLVILPGGATSDIWGRTGAQRPFARFRYIQNATR